VAKCKLLLSHPEIASMGSTGENPKDAREARQLFPDILIGAIATHRRAQIALRAIVLASEQV
jgi:hypothetical protein